MNFIQNNEENQNTLQSNKLDNKERGVGSGHGELTKTHPNVNYEEDHRDPQRE